MSYPKLPDFASLGRELELYSQLKHEYGARGADRIIRKAEKAMQSAASALKRLPIDRKLAANEPDALAKIRKLRPQGKRRIWQQLDEKLYREKLEGAMLGRFAGCTLGSIVEFWPIEKMERWAQEIGQQFPPVEYWHSIPEPHNLRYGFSRCDSYTKSKMNGVPVDDDLAYTLLGLLIVEDAGIDFTVDDVGTAWLKYLPYACTAEHIALENLKKGVSAMKAGEKDNPYCEWIGADIRSDPWGYIAAGWPEVAADMAWRDAYISHRRQGIYGEMYFSAAIAAAFTVDDPVDALKLGLREIPRDCATAKAVRWALKVAPGIKDYRQARDTMEKKFKGMHRVHTINNACLTIWGITIGGTDLTKVISETVAMGMDNDCTAATAGSIVGAVVGKKGIPRHWYKKFNNTVHSYLIRRKKFKIDDLVDRFTKQASKVHA